MLSKETDYSNFPGCPGDPDNFPFVVLGNKAGSFLLKVSGGFSEALLGATGFRVQGLGFRV